MTEDVIELGEIEWLFATVERFHDSMDDIAITELALPPIGMGRSEEPEERLCSAGVILVEVAENHVEGGDVGLAVAHRFLLFLSTFGILSRLGGACKNFL